MDPLVLALDTAGPRICLALVRSERLLADYLLHSSASYLQTLLPALDRLLQDTGLHLSQVDLIAVCRGPGYLTGLRIGLTTAKGLALALGCPLVAADSLELIAANHLFAPLPVCVVLDAKQRQVYAGFYSTRDGRVQLQGDLHLLPPEDLAGRLTKPALLTGWGLETYAPTFATSPAILTPPETWQPRAAILARLAQTRLAAGETLPLDQLTPLYLRPAVDP